MTIDYFTVDGLTTEELTVQALEAYNAQREPEYQLKKPANDVLLEFHGPHMLLESKNDIPLQLYTTHPEIRVVYYTTNTGYTEKFSKKLGYPTERIPQTQGRRGKEADDLIVDYHYILIVPTYGSGAPQTSVMPQIKKFLAIKQNRRNCIGVIAGGNTNFGRGYGIAGDVLAKKLNVPMLWRYEIMGTKRDVEKVREGMEQHWENLPPSTV